MYGDTKPYLYSQYLGMYVVAIFYNFTSRISISSSSSLFHGGKALISSSKTLVSSSFAGLKSTKGITGIEICLFTTGGCGSSAIFRTGEFF
jgi:hypothetical protein